MTTTPPTLSTLERARGGFAMVALDQRESMRDLLGANTPDQTMIEFKAHAGHALAPHASAILLDHPYGLPAGPPAWTAGTPLILAVDLFAQHPGQPVSASTLDPALTPPVIAASGASALKFLALWNPDDEPAERRHLAGSFVALARQCGLPAILEGIVQPPGGTWADQETRDQAVVAAAVEFSAAQPDLYKAQVPGRPDQPAEIEQLSHTITSSISCPWVVLSNGVRPDDFPAAVEAAVRGGASGFLAGRAVWTAAAGAADRAQALRDDAVDRFAAVEAALAAGLAARTP